MSASWIKKLNESNSRLHKEDVIQQALEASILGSENAKIFLSLFQTTYNNYVTFGVKKIPNTVGIVNGSNPWIEFGKLLNDLAKRVYTGHAARDKIAEMSLLFDSEEWNLMCAPVLKRDLRVGISDTILNKICKNTEYVVPKFGCQLASNCKDRPEMKGVKRLEPKLDGARVLMIVEVPDVGTPHATCFSRNGKVYSNFGHIEKQVLDNVENFSKAAGGVLTKSFVLDGEVMSESFQALMKQARRKTGAKATDAELNVFDIIPLEDFTRGWWNAPLRKRLETLEKLRWVFDLMPHVKLLPYIMVDLDTAAGRDQFVRYSKDMVAAGFEGVMIKNLEAPYECRRSTSWMKWKPVFDYDLKVVDIEEGTGKNKGRTGALVCEGIDDGIFIRVNVGSGMTDEQRIDYWDNGTRVIGQTAVVMADAVTKAEDGSYSLRFPRLKTFRDDK